jgi:hypothetical protein
MRADDGMLATASRPDAVRYPWQEEKTLSRLVSSRLVSSLGGFLASVEWFECGGCGRGYTYCSELQTRPVEGRFRSRVSRMMCGI